MCEMWVFYWEICQGNAIRSEDKLLQLEMFFERHRKNDFFIDKTFLVLSGKIQVKGFSQNEQRRRHKKKDSSRIDLLR